MVTAHNKNISYEEYIESLPLDNLIQLHICQPELPTEGIARDTHNEPNDDMFKEVIRLLNTYQSIKYLTIEYYKVSERSYRINIYIFMSISPTYFINYNILYVNFNRFVYEFYALKY